MFVNKNSFQWLEKITAFRHNDSFKAKPSIECFINFRFIIASYV